MRWWARRRCRGDEGTTDGGSAIIEFIFVAVIVMVPLVYVIVTFATVQRTQLAVTQAARQAGRAFATSDTAAEAPARARAAVRLAMHDQGLDDNVTIRFVRAGASCSSAAVTPSLLAGAVFQVCVTRRVDLPGVPTIFEGRGITSTGRFVLHVDEYRTVAP
jgi:Flp pilus assembly protein TadG